MVHADSAHANSTCSKLVHTRCGLPAVPCPHTTWPPDAETSIVTPERRLQLLPVLRIDVRGRSAAHTKQRRVGRAHTRGWCRLPRAARDGLQPQWTHLRSPSMSSPMSPTAAKQRPWSNSTTPACRGGCATRSASMERLEGMQHRGGAHPAAAAP